MMNFLDKVYGYEYFGIILFTAIGVLIVAFLIVLFFGKKDEKKRKLEETQKLENMNIDAFADKSETASVNAVAPETVPDNVAPVPPVIEPVIPVAPSIQVPEEAPIMPVEPVFEKPTASLENSVVEPVIPVVPTPPVIPEPPVNINVPTEPINPVIRPVEEAPLNVVPTQTTEKVAEEPKLDIPNFNFEELAASISKELNALENMNDQAKNINNEPINEAVVTPMADIVKPVMPEEPAPEIKKAPQVFSSVYVNQPQSKTTEAVVKPVDVVKPEMDLPKPAEMPALNRDTNKDIAQQPTPTAIPDFSQFSGETYDIK